MFSRKRFFFGGEDFPDAELEVVAVNLGSFQDLKYRELSGQRQGYYLRTDDDQNKLSFRSKEIVNSICL